MGGKIHSVSGGGDSTSRTNAVVDIGKVDQRARDIIVRTEWGSAGVINSTSSGVVSDPVNVSDDNIG